MGESNVKATGGLTNASFLSLFLDKTTLMCVYIFLNRTVMDLLCRGSVVCFNSKGIQGNKVKLSNRDEEGGKINLNKYFHVHQIPKSIASSFLQIWNTILIYRCVPHVFTCGIHSSVPGKNIVVASQPPFAAHSWQFPKCLKRECIPAVSCTHPLPEMQT